MYPLAKSNSALTTPMMSHPRGLQNKFLRGESKEGARRAVGCIFRGLVLKYRCHHISVDLMPLELRLTRGQPGLQTNQGCVLLYTTRHGDTMAQHKGGAVCGPAQSVWYNIHSHLNTELPGFELLVTRRSVGENFWVLWNEHKGLCVQHYCFIVLPGLEAGKCQLISEKLCSVSPVISLSLAIL